MVAMIVFIRLPVKRQVILSVSLSLQHVDASKIQGVSSSLPSAGPGYAYASLAHLGAGLFGSDAVSAVTGEFNLSRSLVISLARD